MDIKQYLKFKFHWKIPYHAMSVSQIKVSHFSKWRDFHQIGLLEIIQAWIMIICSLVVFVLFLLGITELQVQQFTDFTEFIIYPLYVFIRFYQEYVK